MGSIADNGSGGEYGYRMSKAAVNMAGKCLSIDLAGKQIAVGILHPGFVKTDMTAKWHSAPGVIDAVTSVSGMMAVIDSKLTMESTGSFWHTNGEELPW